MRIIGIDAAFALTGYAVLEGEALVEYGVIKTLRTVPGDGSKAASEETLGEANLRRIMDLHRAISAVIARNKQAASDGIAVAVEVTDWQPGSQAPRVNLIRDAKAMGALWMGATVVFLACDRLGIAPMPIGANEWMDEFGTHNKPATARVVAEQFPQRFEFTAQGNSYTVTDIVAVPARSVPDHVTDAIAIAFVAQKRIERAAKILAAREMIGN